MARAFGSRLGSAAYDAQVDLNSDGVIDGLDLAVGRGKGTAEQSPPAGRVTDETADFRLADNTRRNYLEPAVVRKGRPESSIRGTVSLGHLHAYQTISEVQATSTAPKNK